MIQSTSTAADDPVCSMCSMEAAPETTVLFRNSQWAAELPRGAEVPGWVVLRSRRHVEHLVNLDDSQLVTFGPSLRDVAAAVGAVMKTETIYVLSFGETDLHFHAVVIPRGADVPVQRRKGDILQMLPEAVDRPKAIDVLSEIRAAYLGNLGSRGPSEHHEAGHGDG